MNKRWLLVPVVIGILAIGITGGAALAHGGGTDGEPPANKFASRVATILELDETQVREAFKQAALELRNEALQQRLDALVAQGHLSQEDADAIAEWHRSRPDALASGQLFQGHRGHGVSGGRIGRGHWFGGSGFHTPPPTSPDTGSVDPTVL